MAKSITSIMHCCLRGRFLLTRVSQYTPTCTILHKSVNISDSIPTGGNFPRSIHSISRCSHSKFSPITKTTDKNTNFSTSQNRTQTSSAHNFNFSETVSPKAKIVTQARGCSSLSNSNLRNSFCLFSTNVGYAAIGRSKIFGGVLENCVVFSVVGSRSYATSARKSVSALTVKLPSRKKMPKIPQEEMGEHVDKVVAYAVAEELNLSRLSEALTEQGLYTICPLPIDAQDAIHVEAKYTVDGVTREIFFFRDGSAVFWSMPEVERKEALKFMRKHDIGRYPPGLILREKEEMDIKYVKGKTGLAGDTLQLNETPEDGHGTLEKYAFSNALAQSVKLAIWEATLETFVDTIEPVTEDLRDGKKINMSRREVLRRTGELFALRHLINLSSDLLDTPDFYWDREVLEPLYNSVCNYLDIARRTRVMNEKLSHCCELTELLSSHLNDAHHTRLEVMIIVLIMVEVVFEIVHYAERYISSQSSDLDPSPLTSNNPEVQAVAVPSSSHS